MKKKKKFIMINNPSKKVKIKLKNLPIQILINSGEDKKKQV